MIRCLIVEDHPIVRAGLRALIENERDMATPAEAGTGAEGLTLAGERTFDIVILDLNLPDLDGLEVLRTLRARPDPPPVLVLSAHAEDQFAVRVLRAGASGFLSKHAAPDDLIDAIRRVVGGRRYVSPELAERLAAALDPRAPDGEPHERLSRREFQVLCMLGKGYSVSEIAGELDLSVKTVSTYRARLREKLHLDTTAELISYAIRSGLVDV